jgi:hypothetical protein
VLLVDLLLILGYLRLVLVLPHLLQLLEVALLYLEQLLVDHLGEMGGDIAFRLRERLSSDSAEGLRTLLELLRILSIVLVDLIHIQLVPY